MKAAAMPRSRIRDASPRALPDTAGKKPAYPFLIPLNGYSTVGKKCIEAVIISPI